MRKIKFTAIVLTVLMAFIFTASNAIAEPYYKPYVNTIELTVKNVPTFESGLGLTTPGDEWYVDSNATGTDAGTSWTDAVLTIDAAINLAAASNGDIIHISVTHAEDYVAANGFDLDKAGLTLIFHRDGENQATLTFSDLDATVACGAANNTIYGGRFLAGISDVVAGIMVEAGCDLFTMVEPTFPEPTTSSFEFLTAIDVAALADDFVIIHPVQRTFDAANYFINASNGVNEDLHLINADLNGAYAAAAIFSDDLDLRTIIAGGSITNSVNGEHAIEYTTSASTGFIANILVRTNAQGTAVDPGTMTMSNVMWDDNDTADTVSIPVVAGGPETQAITDVFLDHLMALDGASELYPENAVDDSTICKMLGDDNPASCATYDNSQHSLEAIGDLVADANQQTNNDTSLDTIHMDHLMALDGTTSKFPEQAVEDSTICKMLGDDQPAVCTTYDNSKHSLEAIGDLVADTNQQSNNDTSAETIYMDHLMGLDGATELYPEQAQEDSTICKMLGDDSPAVCTSYLNSRDSLEAIGRKTDDIVEDTTVVVSATSIYGQSGQIFIVEKTLVSSAIVTGGVDVTQVATGGDIYIEDIIFETNGTGLATGTNLTLERNGGSGVLVFWGEAVSSLGANTSEVLSTGSVTSSDGLVLESGQKLVVKCTSTSCDGSGTITMYIKAIRVTAGANLLPAS